LRRVLAFALDGNLLLAEDVQFSLRIRLLINFAALGRWRDRVEDSAFGDADFDVFGDELVAVAGDANAGVFGRAARGRWFGGFNFDARNGRCGRCAHNELELIKSV